MPAAASELTQLRPGLFIWQNYDSAVKADLFSTGIKASAGVYLVDPIPLADAQLSRLREDGSVAGIVVTNANHQRAAISYSNKFAAPVFAHRDSFPNSRPQRLVEIADGENIGGELEAIEIEGAVAGEIVLYHSAYGGTLIIGDALINFEPYGFVFLPRKYCLNEKKMRQSLRKLLARTAERLLFAHGTPILSGVSAHLKDLLDVGV
jgi:glyoxylase-like metal-dependent hydrolase (beta-lactamase superfamily II)